MCTTKRLISLVVGLLFLSRAATVCLPRKGQGRRRLPPLLSPSFPTALSIHTRPSHQPTLPIPSSHIPNQKRNRKNARLVVLLSFCLLKCPCAGGQGAGTGSASRPSQCQRRRACTSTVFRKRRRGRGECMMLLFWVPVSICFCAVLPSSSA